jgi:hypothetical protein
MQRNFFISLDSSGKLDGVLDFILCSPKTSSSNKVSKSVEAVWLVLLDWRRYPEVELGPFHQHWYAKETQECAIIVKGIVYRGAC